MFLGFEKEALVAALTHHAATRAERPPLIIAAAAVRPAHDAGDGRSFSTAWTDPVATFTAVTVVLVLLLL